MDINWQNGSWQRDGAGPAESRILVAADWAPLQRCEAMMLADPEGVYGDLMPEMQRSDLRLVNFECALGDAGGPIFKAGPNLGGKPEVIAALTSVPFHVATMANNHTFDFGVEAFGETRRLLDGAGVRTVGAGLSEAEARRPLVVDVGGARVGIVNFCEGEDCTDARGDRPGTFGWDVEAVLQAVGRLRDEADVVLVVVHAGREHPPLPPPYIVETYRRIAESGADAVIAHHPHAPQGVEIHRGVPIAYSLGNFLFYERGDLFYRMSGYMVELHLSGRRLSGLRLIPYRLAPEGMQLMKGDLRVWLLGRLQKVSDLLADAGAVRAVWEAFIEGRKEAGFERILEWCLESLRENPPLGAARLRNLFVTPAQRELWTDGLTRMVEGAWGTAPQWACNLVREWTALSVAEGLACPQ